MIEGHIMERVVDVLAQGDPRTVSGIIRDSECFKGEVQRALKVLQEEGTVSEFPLKPGGITLYQLHRE